MTAAGQLDAGRRPGTWSGDLELSIDGPIFTYAFSHFMQLTEGDWLPLGILVLWIACFVFYSREFLVSRRSARPLRPPRRLQAEA